MIGRPSILTRKLIRDLWARKGGIFVIICIVMIGTGCLILMASVYQDIDGTRAAYYRDYRLADFVVNMKRAPASAIELATRVPNVKSVRGRVVIGALVDVPGLAEPIAGQVISMPLDRRPVLNDVHLTSGLWFSGSSGREGILNEAFANANGLKEGDRIKVTLLDEQHDVLIVGTAMSPEFVYLISGDGGFVPDPARFGVIYMPERFVQESSDLDGAFNELIGTVFNDDPAEIERSLVLLEDAFEPWGVTYTNPMQEQPSVRMLRDELMGLKASITVMPTIFLGVALLILNVLMNRMVAQQRPIIGTFKALGYPTWRIALHYISFGAVIGALGGLAGVVFVLWVQPPYVALFATYYPMPGLVAHFQPGFHLMGIAVSVAGASLGALRGAWRAAGLEPAEAMRPPAPEKGAKVFLERWGALWGHLSFKWRLVLRAIVRNPFRSFVSFASTVISTALIITTFSLLGALDYLMDHQFNRMSHQDVTVTLREPVGIRGAAELAALGAIGAVEPQLNIVCDLVNGSRQKRIGLTGLPEGGSMFTPLDAEGGPIAIPKQGIVMSDKLARIMDVDVGDTLSLRPLIGRRDQVEAPVVGIVETYLGLSAYTDIGYLSQLIGEQWVANALLVDSYGDEGWDEMYREIKRRPTVVGVSQRTRSLEQMQATMGESQGAALGSLLLFAGLIAFGSVLNTALVSLSEREREVGTYRVLGYTPGQVAAILRGEIVLLAMLGIVVGLAAGIGLVHLVATAYDTEMYRFPVVIQVHRLAQTVVIMGLFIGAAQLAIRRMIEKMAWLDALKISE